MLQASTPVSLKATAGLRLLPGDKADKILEAVTKFLKTYPFTVPEGGVAILGGESGCPGAVKGWGQMGFIPTRAAGNVQAARKL